MNIFQIEVHTTANLPAATQESARLYRWGQQAKYKKLSDDALKKQLDEFGAHLLQVKQKMLFLALVNDTPDYMPSDARVDFLYNPTYAAAATFIHAYNTHPSWFESGPYLGWLQGLLQASLRRGFAGHGIYGQDDYPRNVKMFVTAGVQTFLASPPAGFEEFCQAMTTAIKAETL